MADLSHRDPLDRFTGLANVYARYRPDYPATAIDFLLEHCGLAPGAVAIDVGCGTGISSRQLAGRGLRVIGIEPNADMRRQALEEAGAGRAFTVQDGRAEATGLPTAGADAVVAAQAFHWFDFTKALQEFHRLLRPGGWVALMWNERDEEDPATAAYGAVVGATSDARAVEGPRREARKALAPCPLFQRHEQRLFRHYQTVDEDGLLGRAFSASYAPRGSAARGRFAAAIGEVFARFQQGGSMPLRYVTSVDVAQRGQ